MSKLSFLDKLKILGDVTSSSGLFIIALLILVFLGYLFFTTGKDNAKNSKKLYILVYISIIVFIIFSYYDSIGKMFDYMMDNLFIAIYFPNLAIYFVAIIVSHIILWKTMFNYDLSKIIKTINISIFCIIHYILILILSVVTNYKLNVFNQESIYGNTNCLALIELSSTIFILWILFLLIYKVVKKYVMNKKSIITIEEYHENIPVEKKIINDSPIIKTKPPLVVSSSIKVKPKVKKEKSVYDDLLTIDDYKLLLEILKKEKTKEKEMSKKEKEEYDEQEKFRQLQELYQSVR